ncbi:hypothetical protein B0H11DRAFT_2271626 [Mycena galericulata]|nr:hypothetical protein B0H11DRAFT_2271626 [Mycena galericulata]
MPPLNNSSASSFLMAALPTNTAAKIAFITFTLACIAYIIRVTSPAHLTRVLVSSLGAAERALLHTLELGTFRCEYAALAERLASLQVDVSLLREAALRDTLSYWATFWQFLKFRRTLAIFRCIQEVRALEIHIDILKEFQLRELEAATAAAARTISMRRRL